MGAVACRAFAVPAPFVFAGAGGDTLLALDEALKKLEALDERRCRVVECRCFAGMSVEETAAAMDCAQGTVKATLHQALRALRRRIERTT